MYLCLTRRPGTLTKINCHSPRFLRHGSYWATNRWSLTRTLSEMLRVNFAIGRMSVCRSRPEGAQPKQMLELRRDGPLAKSCSRKLTSTLPSLSNYRPCRDRKSFVSQTLRTRRCAQRLPSAGGAPLATCRGDSPLRPRAHGVGDTLPAVEADPARPVALLWRGASRLDDLARRTDPPGAGGPASYRLDAGRIPSEHWL